MNGIHQSKETTVILQTSAGTNRGAAGFNDLGERGFDSSKWVGWDRANYIGFHLFTTLDAIRSSHTHFYTILRLRPPGIRPAQGPFTSLMTLLSDRRSVAPSFKRASATTSCLYLTHLNNTLRSESPSGSSLAKCVQPIQGVISKLSIKAAIACGQCACTDLKSTPRRLLLGREAFRTSEIAYQSGELRAGEVSNWVKGPNTPKSAKWHARSLGRQHRLCGHAEH